jgi:hypothetical protein
MIAASDSGTMLMRAAAPMDAMASSRPNHASRGFDHVLQQLQQPAMGEERAGNDGKPVREAMMKLVASALVLPALATLRETPFREGPFAPGEAERRFGPLLDQAVADRVIKGANFPLIDVLVERATGLIGIDSAATSPGSIGEHFRAGTSRAMEVNIGGI